MEGAQFWLLQAHAVEFTKRLLFHHTPRLQAVDLIKKMLMFDPNKRITVSGPTGLRQAPPGIRPWRREGKKQAAGA